MSTRELITELDDCPGCGGWGEIYRGTNPDPECPCTRCGGHYTNTRLTTWKPGSGSVRRTR